MNPIATEDEIPETPTPAVDEPEPEPEAMTESNPTVRFDTQRSFAEGSLEKDDEEENLKARVLDQSEALDRRGPGSEAGG